MNILDQFRRFFSLTLILRFSRGQIDSPELLCRISQPLFNSIGTRILDDTSCNIIKQALRDTTQQLGTVEM